jgi:hypothetical protein
MTARCRRCGLEILWIAKTDPVGPPMRLDPEPSEAGSVIIRMGPRMAQETAHLETAEETAKRLKGKIDAGRTAFVPHTETCEGHP